MKIKVVCLVLGFLFIVSGDLPVSAQTLPALITKEAQVTMSASFGEPVLRLWGYGPSNARVELNGRGVAEFTYAGGDGYFEFVKAYLPAPTGLLYPELCLTAIDQLGRATPPTCIPALPADKFSYDIGPVILPPTLSLDAADASGITLPNSEVKVVLAEDNSRSLGNFSIVAPALAYYIPDYTIKSDSRGNFSFNMPDATPNSWRVFAVTSYSQGVTSPKSNTLKFEVASPAAIAIGKFWAFILSLLTMPVLIILETAVILLIMTTIFLKKKRQKKVYLNNSIPVRQYQGYLRSKRLI